MIFFLFRDKDRSQSLPLSKIILRRIGIVLCCACLVLSACGVIRTTYGIVKGTTKATIGLTKIVIGTGKAVYKLGKFTYNVVEAPLTWPFVQEGLQSIAGLPPKEAIAHHMVKMAPYVVKGKRYVPMSLEKANTYREKGLASWYGYETLRQKGGHMTANGEVFNPKELNAAHKLLPLPSYVRVTNLKNRRSLIVRVNDRGPFIEGRIIDLSAGAAKKLGYYDSGVTNVLVETVLID